MTTLFDVPARPLAESTPGLLKRLQIRAQVKNEKVCGKKRCCAVLPDPGERGNPLGVRPLHALLEKKLKIKILVAKIKKRKQFE